MCNKRTCKQCDYLGDRPFWGEEEGWNLDKDLDIAECRRLPPTFCSGVMTHKEYGVFPVVFLDWWCGEWRLKDDKSKQKNDTILSTIRHSRIRRLKRTQ